MNVVVDEKEDVDEKEEFCDEKVIIKDNNSD